MPDPSEPLEPGDSHRSIGDGEEVEIREKGSRFLGQAFRADDEETVTTRLASVRREHPGATHHCCACRVGPDGSSIERTDDDGEPRGTAGAPILSVLRGAEISDALLVVTRWFGGTKLGRGGLVRAYSRAARAALEAAPERIVWHESIVTVECGYEDVGEVEAVLAREGSRIRGCDRDFARGPKFRARVLVSQAERLRAALVEATAGRARIAVAAKGAGRE
jgi:uncharacterized YigZ family protein